MQIRFVVIAAAILGAIPAQGQQVPTSNSALRSVLKVEAAPEWESKFAGKEGWIGGDGVGSCVLNAKRILWLFGDTILGTVKDGKRTGASMVNNTVAIQTGFGRDAVIRFISGKKDGKATAVFVPVDGTGWFWPQSAHRVEAHLYVFLAQIERTKGTGIFAFRQIGQWLAVVENPDDEPEVWRMKQHKITCAEFAPERTISWGSAVLTDGKDVYVYGIEEKEKGIGKRRLLVAKTAAKELADFGTWQFRTATGWSDKPAEALPLASGLATEFSVSRLPGDKGYVAVCTENGLGDRIVGRFAVAPEGPWSDAVLLYKCPEMGKDKGVFSYAGKAHPWAGAGNELLVSYCVNAWDFGRLFSDETVYRPKFVKVVLETGPQP